LGSLKKITLCYCSRYTEHYYEARIGLLRRSSFSPSEQVRKISHIIEKRNYDSSTMKNDLALMKLDTPVLFGKWVKPACLPVNRADILRKVEGPPTGAHCIAIGWGAVREKGFDRKFFGIYCQD